MCSLWLKLLILVQKILNTGNFLIIKLKFLIILLIFVYHYSVAVTRSKEVEMFGPPIPSEAVFKKSKEFSNFLLAKSK